MVTAVADWDAITALFKRPQPLTTPMVALFAIIPFYLFIGGELLPGRTLYAPELGLDAMFPLRPEWSFVYGSLFCAALLPVFVLHQRDLIRRTLLAFIAAWLFSYVIFIAFPTVAPSHPKVAVHSFSDWGLRTIYDADVKYNAFSRRSPAIACIAVSGRWQGCGPPWSLPPRCTPSNTTYSMSWRAPRWRSRCT